MYLRSRNFYMFLMVTGFCLFTYALIHSSVLLAHLLWHNQVLDTAIAIIPVILLFLAYRTFVLDRSPLPYMVDVSENYEIYKPFLQLVAGFKEIKEIFGINKPVQITSYSAPVNSADSDLNASIFSYQDITGNYIIIPLSFFYKNKRVLLGICFHEMGHILCNHSKINVLTGIVYYIGYLYTVVFSLLLGIFIHSIPVAIICFVLLPPVMKILLYSLNQFQEYTADGVAAFIGFSDELIRDLRIYSYQKHITFTAKISRLFKPHPSEKSRLTYLEYLKNKYSL